MAAPLDQPRAVPVGVPAEAEAHGDQHGGLEELDAHDGGDLGAEQAGPAQRRGPEALEHAVAALEPGGDAQRHHGGRHDGQGEDARHEEVDGRLTRRGHHVHGGEEQQEDDRDAHGQQQRLAAAQCHEHLGPGLGRQRPHVRPPRRRSRRREGRGEAGSASGGVTGPTASK